MSRVDRWLLPDGIEEVLPTEASHIEGLRRGVVNLFQSWGYDYVIPPMVEFIDSLLTGSGEKANLDTFKVTDQLSGKTMGIRADITPQAARMDAHSLKREGINRLCYAGHVMYTKPKSPLASRTPIQVGVELFGESGLDADKEVISLLLETLKVTGLPQLYLDIGHVGVYRGLIKSVNLSVEQEARYFELLQSKSSSSIQRWIEQNISDSQAAQWLQALPSLAGDESILTEARSKLSGAPSEVLDAISELEKINSTIKKRYPQSQCYFDLAELRGYHYYTGLIFGAFAPGVGNAIANGGRYDHVGESFGRARPATGFTANLTAMSKQNYSQKNIPKGIFVTAAHSERLWREVNKLRSDGERVVSGLANQQLPFEHQLCDRQLIPDGESFVIQSIK